MSRRALHALLICLLSELFGTFILTFADTGAGMAAVVSSGQITLPARALAPGLAVLAMIFAVGERSGAHLNPAVTFGFAVRGVFPWNRVPLYWLVQFLGAILAAVLLRLIMGDVAHLGATEPLTGIGSAFAMEVVLTFLLISVILSTASQHKIKGPDSAFPVGAALVVCGLVGKAVSGASMNPARSLGPALVSGHMSGYWIYIAAPLIGSAFAVLLVRLIHGRVQPSDVETAMGEKNVKPSRRHQ